MGLLQEFYSQSIIDGRTNQKRSGALETWWWNYNVDNALSENMEHWRTLEAVVSRTDWKLPRRVFYTALKNDDLEKFLRAGRNKDEIFKPAKLS